MSVQITGTAQPLPPGLSAEDRLCIEQLQQLQLQDDGVDILLRYPRGRTAAVLVLLSMDQDGSLSVTLTTRALTLRSHPGETALPGGRVEEADSSVEDTALREAYEEIGLPLTGIGILHVANLPAFLSRNLLVVVPVIYLLLSPLSEVLPVLQPNPDEVAAIFHCPLKAFHLPTTAVSPAPAAPLTLSHSFTDIPWILSKPYRYHSFTNSTLPSPVSGLTADILIFTALQGYGTEAEKERQVGRAAEQLPWADLIENVLSGKAGGAGDQRSRSA